LDNALQNGWVGHHEVTIPTIMQHNRMKIVDMGRQAVLRHELSKTSFIRSKQCGGSRYGQLSEKIAYIIQ
jgi:hypothetical protein